MTTYDLGASVTHVWTGAPTGGTPAVALTRPNGTSFTPPALGSSGQDPSVTFTPDMAGRWFIRWNSTVVPGAYSEIADVWPTDPRFLISTDDAKAGLNWPATGITPAQVDDLRLYIAAATPVIEDITGPVMVQTYTQLVQRGWQYANLNNRPVTQIVSMIYSDGTALDPDNYIFDPIAGSITYYTPTQDIATITYMAGLARIPQNVRLGTRELVRHWWQIGKQGLRSMNGTMPISADAWTPSGFAVPRRVIELCNANQQPGGFG